MSNVEAKHLFTTRRFTDNEWKFLSLLFYSPFGLLLVSLRCALVTLIFCLCYILPDNTFCRMIINKSTCLSFGITVAEENVDKKEENVDVYVSNSRSIFDNLAIRQVTNSISSGPKFHPLLAKSIGVFPLGTSYNNLKQKLKEVQLTEKTALYVAPEGKYTNGKALIQFNISPFSFGNKVQPICLEIQRPFLDISVTTLGSSSFVDIFFYMFSPTTNYKVKFLQCIEKNDMSDDALADSVRRKIAEALEIEAVNLSAVDLNEYEKRQLAERKRMRADQSITNPSLIPALRRMASQVKEVLPHVPLDDIYKDLYRTRNVDNTITNILEGRVQFVAETLTPSSNTPSTSAQRSVSSNASTLSSNFSKSVQERSKSFQDRKRELIANARKRYIEKHNLDIV